MNKHFINFFVIRYSIDEHKLEGYINVTTVSHNYVRRKRQPSDDSLGLFK